MASPDHFTATQRALARGPGSVALRGLGIRLDLVTTQGTQTADLHHRRMRLEPGPRGDVINHATERLGLKLARPAAIVAQHENGDGTVPPFRVGTGHIGIAALDAMDKALLHEKFQRSIDRDRGKGRLARFLAQLVHPVQNIIGAGGNMAGSENFEHRPALFGEPQPALLTDLLDRTQKLADAMTVIMVFEFDHLPTLLLHAKIYTLRFISCGPKGLRAQHFRTMHIPKALPSLTLQLSCATLYHDSPWARACHTEVLHETVQRKERDMVIPPSVSHPPLDRTHKGRTALITGSTSGIGLGVARALASHGANIVLNGLGDSDEIQRIRAAIAKDYRVQVMYHDANMLHPEEIEAMIREVESGFGQVDILVNNAGIQHVSPVDEFPISKWDDIIAINLSSNFHTIRAALPKMKLTGRGRIINISSAHSLVASPYKSAYVAAKHGVAGLTKTVALEVAEQGITVNAIAPGYVWTPLVEAQIPDTMASRNMSEEEVKREVLLAAQPTKQFVTIEQVAELAVYLASDAASAITGSTLSMDGGWTAK